MAQNRDFCLPTCIRRLRYGSTRRNIAMTFGMKKLERFGKPDGEIFLKICLFISTESTNITDTHTNKQTPHDGIGRAYA